MRAAAPAPFPAVGRGGNGEGADASGLVEVLTKAGSLSGGLRALTAKQMELLATEVMPPFARHAAATRP